MRQEFSTFAETTYKQKYARTKEGGTKEEWREIASRVAGGVLGAVNASAEMVREVAALLEQRKFIPGGRYLYATGREYHQTQNCALFRAEDSREDWAELMQKITVTLMSGAGIGVVYSNLRERGALIRRTGGESTGPLALMQMVNEAGRHIMQGGSRRSAIWAGLHWNHPDIHDFIRLKDWDPELRALKARDFNFPCTMDHTNISVILDDAFFEALNNKDHAQHTLAHGIYWTTVKQMLQTSEPGFSIDVGENHGENLRNACVPYETRILTKKGYLPIGDLVGSSVEVWNGKKFSTVKPRSTGMKQLYKIEFSDGTKLECSPNHEFLLKGGEKIKAEDLQIGHPIEKYEMPVIYNEEPDTDLYSQGFYSGDGNKNLTWSWLYDTKYCCKLRLKGKFSNENRNRVRWAHGEMLPKSFVPHTSSVKSKVDWLAGLLDADGTIVRNKNSLNVQLGSVDKWFLQEVQLLLTTLGCSCSVTQMRKKGNGLLPDGRGGEKEYYQQAMYRLHIGHNFLLKLVTLGLGCCRLTELSSGMGEVRESRRFPTVTAKKFIPDLVEVFCFNEPETHRGCFEGIITGQCTEITSHDDSDICNLGSINVARIETLSDMANVVRLATAFLLAGTKYSLVPFREVDKIRTKNRRLGLGLMGLHEWLLQRGKKYGPDRDLEEYLNLYREVSDSTARGMADRWSLSSPVKVRAIAPTGTIGIVAETTTGIEPVFCCAYKRRYLKGDTWHYQYVVEPIAKRLIEGGMDPDDIEDAYTIDTETRLQFQAWVQTYVDHGISSTINLPAWGTEQNNSLTVEKYGNLFLKYLPKLRGLTVYADGSRGGQPLTPVSYDEAMKHVGAEFIEESANICSISGRGGSCGE
jgi:ribonucleotide reductase alpha subunit